MPRIDVPQVLPRTSGLDVAVPRYAQREFRINQADYAADAFNEITKLSLKFIDSEKKIKAESDELTAIKASVDFDKSVTEYAQHLDQTFPITEEKHIGERQRLLTEHIDGKTRDLSEGLSVEAMQSFKKHAVRETPSQLIKFKAASLKNWSETNTANLNQLEDDLSHLAATGTPEQAQKAVLIHQEAANRALMRGFINPINRQLRETRFNKKIDQKNIEHLLFQGPAGRQQLRERAANGQYIYADAGYVSEKIHRANALDAQEDANAERWNKRTESDFFEYYGSMIAQGHDMSGIIEEGLKGNNPSLVDQQKWRTLKSWQESTTASNSTTQLDVIKYDYGKVGGLAEEQRPAIAQARKSVDNLVANLDGKPNKDIYVFLSHLQEVERALDRLDKGDNAANRAEIGARIAEVRSRFDAMRGPIEGFRALDMRKETLERQTENAWAEAEIRKGRGVEGVLKQGMEKFMNRINPPSLKKPDASAPATGSTSPTSVPNSSDVLKQIKGGG